MKDMERIVFSLTELLGVLEETVDVLFPSAVWVTAEIADIRCDQSGHWYLELVEKQDGELKARVRGTIWASLYPAIATPFRVLTGQNLAKGMEILALVKVRFHPVYGLSLDIRNIDPQYSLGAMMRHRKEVLSRLAQEGLLEANRCLPFPLVPQRIAVLSSPYAAGFEDFVTHLTENPHGFRFLVELFPIFVQGEELEPSILSALAEVKRRIEDFDLLVILRGGGAQSDLHWFDSYTLGRAIATFPLPVLVGIGHQKDETVLDAVAHLSLKTPTAVADFLIERMQAFDDLVLEASRKLQTILERFFKEERNTLALLFGSLERITQAGLRHAAEETTRFSWETKEYAKRLLEKASENLSGTWEKLTRVLEKILKEEAALLENTIRTLLILDPQNILRRGYTLTLKEGKVVRSAKDCAVGDRLETWFADGEVVSEVKNCHVPIKPHVSGSF